jgi:hypothetical protein
MLRRPRSGRIIGMTKLVGLDDDLEIEEVTISRAVDGDYDVLRSFSAVITCGENSEGECLEAGVITGFVGWRVFNEDVWEAADAISADAEVLGAAAREIIEWLGDEYWIDTVLFVDRVGLHPEFRGRRRLRTIVERMIDLLRLDRDSTVIVTQPEPQRKKGRPYPDGPVRDDTLAHLTAAHEATGFRRWRHSSVWWLPGPLGATEEPAS